MSSLWDEIKDLFKTDKQLEEERQQKINSALEKESDVSKRLAELEKQYNSYTTKISDAEQALNDYEDKWYKKFSSMETA